MLDFVVDNYQPIVEDFRDELDVLEKDIFAEDYRRDTIVKLYELKRELTQMRLVVSPLQDVVGFLTRAHGNLVPEEVLAVFPRRPRPRASRQRRHRHHARNADRGDERQPVPGDRRPGRGRQAPGRLGRFAGGARPSSPAGTA